MTVYDYARSFVTFVTPGRGNNARLQVESLSALHHGQTGKTTDYFLFALDVDLQVKRLSPAYVAYNAPDFADFVVQQPLPLVVEGAEIVVVTHYSNPVSLSAKTQVIAVR